MANIPVIPGVKVATKGILNKPIKDIICAILFGGLNNMLKGNLICIEANLNEILEDQGLANLTDLKDALRELKDEVKAFQDHLGVGEAIKRINSAIADVQKVLSLGGMCPVPFKAPKIPDVLGQVTNSYFGAANSILNDLGRLAKPQLCLDANGGINTGAYKPDSILGSLNRKIGKLGDIPGNELNKLTKSIKGVSGAIRKQINRELFPDFRHKHNLLTGTAVVAGAAAITIADVNAAHSQALQISSGLGQTGSYPIKGDGVRFDNAWASIVGPDIYALAVESLTAQDPTLIRQEPVYDYCGRLVGYEEVVVAGEREAEGGDPFDDADLAPLQLNYSFLWVDGTEEDPDRLGWAVEGNVSEQMVGPTGAQRRVTALNLNPEITLYRGRSHIIRLPSAAQQEFYIYETKVQGNQRVPDISKRFSHGLMRFETNEFLDEANGRNEDSVPWYDTSLPEDERNSGPEPEAWRRKDLFPDGMTLMINVAGIDDTASLAKINAVRAGQGLDPIDPIQEPNWADQYPYDVIFEEWPDYLAYSNQSGSVFGLFKLS